ncbi:MAG: sporulation protein YabP [Alicyclobacillaceae bacterium]|nr:sporulation protein YabP [Alicyclobacillaceae bacterium]
MRTGVSGGWEMPGAEQHDIAIKGRKVIEVTGVSSVESFDVREFTLTTVAGPLQIRGTNLHMKHLDLQVGVVHIEGTVSSLEYLAERPGKKRIAAKWLR